MLTAQSVDIQHVCSLKGFVTPTDVFETMRKPFARLVDTTRAMEGKVATKRDHSVIIQINVTGDICRWKNRVTPASRGGWETFSNCCNSTVIERSFSQAAPSPSSDIFHTGLTGAHYRNTKQMYYVHHLIHTPALFTALHISL